MLLESGTIQIIPAILTSYEGCLQPLDPGPCREYVVKWYFDPKANSCAQFWFGGCQGNKNHKKKFIALYRKYQVFLFERNV
uniref:BPTI/Kunitz inhibitor domain-containing protein n=1 Tax=Sinocyclocheilus grahami TaxID=75366 RepID=A0A672KM19_SINGR